MRRREFITLLGGAAAWPLAARAQQPAMPVIGFLSNIPPESYARVMPSFRQGLKETGFVEGQNVAFDYHWTSSEHDLPALAAAMVTRKPTVILAWGGTASTLALKNATATIPIIFLIGADPVRFGLVASLSRPGGNLTGVTSLSNSLTAKQLEMLHELVPNATTVGLLVNPRNPNAEFDTKDVRAGADLLGISLIVVKAGNEDEINTAITSSAEHRVAAMLVASDLFFLRRRTQIVALSARYALPTMYDRPEYVAAGGLMSYGSNRNEIFRQAGTYAGRMLRGEKPSELPVQQATKFELVINVQTAKALGFTIPPTLLARADEVIE
jgi:putative tryptophan/tyrosine transport system substrate-binding protein